MADDVRDITARNLGEVTVFGLKPEHLVAYGSYYVRAQRRRESGVKRRCAADGCSTVLSSYNDADRCSVHE